MDDLGLKTPRVYSIPCEFSQVYIGQTGCSIETRLKEHQQHICLERLEKPAMAEHSVNLRHCIELHHIVILSTKPRQTCLLASVWARHGNPSSAP
jgi:hypothetical protein